MGFIRPRWAESDRQARESFLAAVNCLTELPLNALAAHGMLSGGLTKAEALVKAQRVLAAHWADEVTLESLMDLMWEMES